MGQAPKPLEPTFPIMHSKFLLKTMAVFFCFFPLQSHRRWDTTVVTDCCPFLLTSRTDIDVYKSVDCPFKVKHVKELEN